MSLRSSHEGGQFNKLDATDEPIIMLHGGSHIRNTYRGTMGLGTATILI